MRRKHNEHGTLVLPRFRVHYNENASPPKKQEEDIAKQINTLALLRDNFCLRGLISLFRYIRQVAIRVRCNNNLVLAHCRVFEKEVESYELKG